MALLYTAARGRTMHKQDLKKAGLKVTIPRMRILEIMERSEEHHLTAEDIYRKLLEEKEEIGLATVYRVLTQFESAGIVMRHHFSEKGSACYELDHGGHHDHMVCIQCGEITEFMDDTIERRQCEIADKHGYAISDHSLVMYVDCLDRNCKNRDRDKSR